ncbi:MAG: DUF2189 domain-containing protein [Halioglobus sp.]
MATLSHHEPVYPVRNVPLTRPFVWLASGWDDLLHHRAASIAYGLIVTALGILILGYERHPVYVATAMAGFMLIGPIMAAGLCELSRCRDLNEVSDFDSSLKALRRNHDSLINLASTLLVIGVVWFAVSYVVIQAALGTAAPSLEQTVWGDVMRHLSSAQIMAYFTCAGLLAVVVFALSVVAVPMIVERHVNARTAMSTSVRVAMKDFPAMLVWAALIVALVAIAFVTAMVAMVVIYPLLGHATWYAYRDLVT